MSCLRLGTREYLMEGYAAASQALLLHQEESDPERRWGDGTHMIIKQITNLFADLVHFRCS
jgi:hypothetical protein